MERLGEQLEDDVLRVVRAREQDFIQPAVALVLVEVPGQLLGIEQPIVGGPMAGVNTPELAAAVSNAGGLGSIGCGMMEPEAIEAAIARIRALTDKPFAVNLFITPQPAVDESQILRMQARLAPYRSELGLPRGKLPARFAPDFVLFVTFCERLDVAARSRSPQPEEQRTGRHGDDRRGRRDRS